MLDNKINKLEKKRKNIIDQELNAYEQINDYENNCKILNDKINVEKLSINKKQSLNLELNKLLEHGKIEIKTKKEKIVDIKQENNNNEIKYNNLL